MGKSLIILILFISCSNSDEDMKKIIQSLPSTQPLAEINIIIAGQSNAVSRNDETDGIPTDLPSNGFVSNAKYWDGDSLENFTLNMNIQGDNVGGYGIEYRIAKRILDSKKALKVNLLKYALGGSRIGESGAWNITDGSLLSALILEANQSALSFDYFIWIQGENDSTTSSLANAYETNLTGFINHIEANIDLDKFIIVKLADFPAYPSGTTPFLNIAQQAQTDVSNNIPRQMVIPPNPSTYRDQIHYDSDGIDALAQKIYNEVF